LKFCGESDRNYFVAYLAVCHIGLGPKSVGRVGSGQSKVTYGQLSVECSLFSNSTRYADQSTYCFVPFWRTEEDDEEEFIKLQ